MADRETPSSLVRREAPVLEPKIDRKRELGESIAGHAVEHVLGDRVPEDVKAVLKSQLAPWAERLVRVTDELIRIPGTDIHIGLDPILGALIPGAGDVITGAGSVALLFLALKERIPTVAIGRMVVNILVDTIAGSVPVVGDAFDVVWRANRKNYEIIQQYRNDPKAEPSNLDYALVYGGIALVGVSIVVPVVLAMVFGLSIGALFSQ